MTASNPVVVAPHDSDAEPLDNLDGGGVFESLDDAAAPLLGADRDAGGVVADVASVGVELMGAAMHPLDALAGAGIGWLIEHVSVLHEPLDWLAGDPTVITAQAHTWHNVCVELAAVAEDFQRTSDGVRGWDGAAMQAYRRAAGSYARALQAGSAHAAGVSESVSAAGVLVGTTRAMIRDWIADLVGELIAKWVVAALAAAETFAVSVAAFVADAIASAMALASRIAARIARLVETLGRHADDLRVSKVLFDRLGTEAQRVAESVRHAHDRWEWPMKATSELGKQWADARGDQRAWRGGEPPPSNG